MLKILSVDSKENLFDELGKEKFESIVKGRLSAVLVEPFENKIPIVRTSTIYNNPAQRLRNVHQDIIKRAYDQGKKEGYNNAMIEIYDEQYKKMNFHSDQVFDVQENSDILTYSCYEDPTKPNRMFVFQDKKYKKEQSIVLQHDSMLVMPWIFNQNYLHKIVMVQNKDIDQKNKYMAVTYRKSKTFVDPDTPHIHKANYEEKKEFYGLCRSQNSNYNFKSSVFDYAISTAEFSLNPELDSYNLQN